MKPYVFLAIGATWLIAAISFLRSSFNIVWTVKHDPALVLALFRWLIPLLLLGRIAPLLVGTWLLWKSQFSN
jgi:hypothetical protein